MTASTFDICTYNFNTVHRPGQHCAKMLPSMHLLVAIPKQGMTFKGLQELEEGLHIVCSLYNYL
jgi:hypothetical protein